MRTLLLVAAFSLFGISVFAHPPSNIDISTNENTVQITVAHGVKDAGTHYINIIEVSLNGKKIIEQSFLFQFDKNVQKATYFLPGLKKGDELVVDADCNLSGDLNKKYIVQ